jgi:hypothetical protein
MLPKMSKSPADVLGVLQVFIGLGALAGGLGLALEPSGARLEVPLELLEKSPFSSDPIRGSFFRYIGLPDPLAPRLVFRSGLDRVRSWLVSAGRAAIGSRLAA